MKNLIKDLVISLLLVISIVLIISVIFYDEISIKKMIPESEEYVISDEMQEELDKAYINEDEEIITTYYIDGSDLKKYEKTKEYDKGKKNPFAKESIETISNEMNSNETTSSLNNSTEEGFYGSEGIK